MNLEECRKQIDEIDAGILELLKQRSRLAQRIAGIKAAAGLPVIDLEREEVVLRRIMRENDGDVDERSLTRIYVEILDESRRIQSTIVRQLTETGEAA